jgi:hypothetical protein
MGPPDQTLPQMRSMRDLTKMTVEMHHQLRDFVNLVFASSSTMHRASTPISKQELVFQRMLEAWSVLLADPIATVLPDARSKIGVLPPVFGIGAVSLHAAGDFQVSGRRSDMVIGIRDFDNYCHSMREFTKTVDWTVFSELFLKTYWRLFGRSKALAHSLLHCERPARDYVLHLDISTPCIGSAPFIEASGTRHNISLGGLWYELGLEDSWLREFVVPVMSRTVELTEEQEELNDEALSEAAADSVLSPGIAKLKAHLQMKARGLAVRLATDSKLREDLLNALGLGLNDIDEQAAVAVGMLQLAALYRGMGGDHFYIFVPYVPPTHKEGLRACFYAGSHCVQKDREIDTLEFLAKEIAAAGASALSPGRPDMPVHVEAGRRHRSPARVVGSQESL